MTGPEPGDLAEITWQMPHGPLTKIGQWDANLGGWWLFGIEDVLFEDQPTSVRPLSVVATDSLQALADDIEALCDAEADHELPHVSIRHEALIQAAAAVRSAITKPTKEES